MIVQDFLFRKIHRGICTVAKWIVNTKFLYQAVYVMQFNGENNIYGMEERHVFSNITDQFDPEKVEWRDENYIYIYINTKIHNKMYIHIKFSAHDTFLE